MENAGLGAACVVAGNFYQAPLYLESLEVLAHNQSKATVRVTSTKETQDGCGVECYGDFQVFMDSTGSWTFSTAVLVAMNFKPTAKSLALTATEVAKNNQVVVSGLERYQATFNKSDLTIPDFGVLKVPTVVPDNLPRGTYVLVTIEYQSDGFIQTLFQIKDASSDGIEEFAPFSDGRNLNHYSGQEVRIKSYQLVVFDFSTRNYCIIPKPVAGCNNVYGPVVPVFSIRND